MVRNKLNELYNLYENLKFLERQKKELIDSVITPEIRETLNEIDVEFDDKEKFINKSIATLESEIKSDVLALGESVKGDYLMAVYTKGRVSWDTKLLDGYATAHPEILQFKQIGNPSVSIRANK